MNVIEAAVNTRKKDVKIEVKMSCSLTFLRLLMLA